MARQPRFIEDDEPKKARKKAKYEEAVKEEPKPVKPDPVDEEEDIPDISRYLDEDDAEIDSPEPEEAPAERGGRFEPDDDDEQPRRSSGKRLALLIAAMLLGFAIVGTGVYALVHFVFMPDNNAGGSVQATETVPPTMPDEPTLTPAPTQPPTQAPTQAPDYNAMADLYMKDMSDRDKMCQMFIVTPEVLTSALDDSGSDGAVTLAGAMTEKSLEEYPVGGIIYFAGNLVDVDQTKTMIENSQGYASTPLFIAVDEEGGDVARVADKLGTKKFKPMLDYKDKGETVAHDNAEIIASNIRAIGFNMDNAPVADVLSNPDNTVIGSRAYSDDFAQAATLVKAAVEGFRDGGVVTVLKHFPGHGSTAEDTHDRPAYVKSTVEELKKNELQPFKAGIDAGADMVMVGHLIVSDLDPEMPASLSSKVVPELLRKELGYNGIVITDSMQMGAVTGYDYETIVKGLFDADVDVILQPDDLDSYLSAMQSLLDDGTITQEQIDAKVRKIIALKIKQGILKVSAEPSNPVPDATQAPASTAPAGTDATEVIPIADASLPEPTEAPVEEPSVAA